MMVLSEDTHTLPQPPEHKLNSFLPKHFQKPRGLLDQPLNRQTRACLQAEDPSDNGECIRGSFLSS